MKGSNVWVVRRAAGFSITLEGAPKRIVEPITQGSAMRIARLIARANRSDLFVQGLSGKIRTKDSHGFDSPRRKG